MRSLAILTTSRADYGILKPLISKLGDLNESPLLIVSGTHLLSQYGMTINEIDSDVGHVVRVPINSLMDNTIDLNGTFSEFILKMSAVLNEQRPKCLVLLGDRYETFATAVAAYNLGIPIAHLHGGEVTEGSNDNAYRNCISQLSQIHFAATKKSAERLVAMGLLKEHVHFVGSLSLSMLTNVELMSRLQLESSVGLELNKRYIILSLHPSRDDIKECMKLIDMITVWCASNQVRLITSASNIDKDGLEMTQYIEKLSRKYSDTIIYRASYGHHQYTSLMAYANLMISNSSSGIIESPILNLRTINVGNRQQGRELGVGCKTLPMDVDVIFNEMVTLMDEDIKPKLIAQITPKNSPYYLPDTDKRISEVLLKSIY